MKKFKISKEEAIEKINSIKNKIRESQNNMTEFDFNSMIPSKKEHWLKKGFSEEDAEMKVIENKKQSAKNCNDFIKRVKDWGNDGKIKFLRLIYTLKKLNICH